MTLLQASLQVVIRASELANRIFHSIIPLSYIPLPMADAMEEGRGMQSRGIKAEHGIEHIQCRTKDGCCGLNPVNGYHVGKFTTALSLLVPRYRYGGCQAPNISGGAAAANRALLLPEFVTILTNSSIEAMVHGARTWTDLCQRRWAWQQNAGGTLVPKKDSADRVC